MLEHPCEFLKVCLYNRSHERKHIYVSLAGMRMVETLKFGRSARWIVHRIIESAVL